MTDNEINFWIALAFVLGHVTAWLGVWVHWRRR